MIFNLFPFLLISLFHTRRSLSELEALRVSGDVGDKMKQVTERATLFRITSNAMINVSHPSVHLLLNAQHCLLC